MREFSTSRRSDALYQGTTLQAAEIFGLFEGDGLQAVRNCYVMNSALAAEGRFFSAAVSCAIDAQQRCGLNSP